MKWTNKSRIQNIISLLPSSLSYSTYYWVQRNFGSLQVINPVKYLMGGIEIWDKIIQMGGAPKHKTFFEVGTGRMPLAPLAYWLMGAKTTYTVDLNPYVKGELIKEALHYIYVNKTEIEALFGVLLITKRFETLMKYIKMEEFSVKSFLSLTNIIYIAPCDASDTNLKNNSIDFHTSYQVYEHIPKKILANIIKEGNRLIKSDGIFINKIDYSDHFSHSDDSISAINFLQYSDLEWNKYAGNRYMYMNRLRHDDFIGLLRTAGHMILSEINEKDMTCLNLLKANELNINEKFSDKPHDILSIRSSWVISAPKSPIISSEA